MANVVVDERNKYELKKFKLSGVEVFEERVLEIYWMNLFRRKIC